MSQKKKQQEPNKALRQADKIDVQLEYEILSLNEFKQQMIKQYIIETNIGTQVTPNSILYIQLMGKKQQIKILVIQPQGMENEQFQITKQTQINFVQEQIQKIIISNLQYIDDVLDQLDNQIQSFDNPEFKNLKFPQVKGILLVGNSGSGKTKILDYLFQKYQDLNPIIISHLDQKFEDQRLFIHKLLKNKVILVDDIIQQDKDSQQANNQFFYQLFQEIENTDNLVIATCISKNLDERLKRCGRFEKEILIENPNYEKRVQILDKELEKLAIKDIEYIRDLAYQLSGFTIYDLLSLIRDFYLQFKKNNDVKKAFKIALELTNPQQYQDLNRIEWTDIGGYDHIKQEVLRVVEWPLKFPDDFNRLGIKPSKGILLYGPPGCSKTLIARALCTQCNMQFIAVKGPEIFSKYVGDSEKTIREIFRKARLSAPSIIFFDEIDAIAPQRKGQTDVSDRVLIQLLTEMDGFDQLKNVIVIGATNRPECIDKALMRPGRFDHLIFVDVPNKNAREQIFKVNLQKMKVADINLDQLVNKTEGYTGAEITQICKEAGLIAISRDIKTESIKHDDFVQSIQKVKPGVSFFEREKFVQFLQK
ncbi:hypothetical protein pb186bvf_013136 [Paramecium bursaria]